MDSNLDWLYIRFKQIVINNKTFDHLIGIWIELRDEFKTDITYNY